MWWNRDIHGAFCMLATTQGVFRMSSIFNGTIRRSGNSLVITIPKPIAEGLGLKDGDSATLEIRKLGDQKEDY